MTTKHLTFDSKLTNNMTLEKAERLLAICSADHQHDYSQPDEIDTFKLAYASVTIFGTAIEAGRFVEMTDDERATAVRIVWAAYLSGVLRDLPDRWDELLTYDSASAVIARG